MLTFKSSRMFFVTLIALAFLACVQGLYGANPSSIWDHPYQAAVLRRQWDTSEFRFVCSGAIVSQTFILTTASCIRDSRENFRVRVGSSYPRSGGDLYRVSDVYRHANVTADLDYDIALLKLAYRLMLNSRTAIVNLPKQDEVLNPTADIRMWSISSWDFDSEAVLQTVSNPKVVSGCNSIYGKFSPDKELVTDNMICVSVMNDRGPCCERDQGGLLMVAGTLYGLSSWSYRCGFNSYPSVFTRVSAFTTWIGSMLKL